MHVSYIYTDDRSTTETEMPAITDRTLTPSAAARVAGVSEQTLRAWLKSGRLPHSSTPLGRLVDRADLDQFLARRRAQESRQ